MEEYVVMLRSKGFKTEKEASACFDLIEMPKEFEIKSLSRYEGDDFVEDLDFSYKNDNFTLLELKDKLEELENLFGGYTGQGNLLDEIDWLVGETKALCNTLNNSANQIQKVDKSISATHKKIGLDPKGHVVLAEFGDRALVFTNKDAVQPFVVAHGYDSETGEWAHGLYFSDLGTAYDFANPEIFEGAVVRIEREDISEKLKEYGVLPSYENIQEVIFPDTGMKPLAQSIHDNMLDCARENIDARVKSLMDASRLDVLERKDKEYSLSSERRDLSRAKEVLDSGRESDLQSRDER